MSGTLIAAVSGMDANQGAITSAGGNIANTNTVANKVAKVSFANVITNSKGSSSPSSGGTRAIHGYNVEQQGMIEATGSSTDLAISGTGMFLVSKGDLIAMKRAGNFNIDTDGRLVDSGGHALQGWAVDETGAVTANNTGAMESLKSINVSNVAGVSRETTNLDLMLNLPSNKALNGTETTIVQVYDSLGEPHDLTVTWKLTSKSPLTWTADITTPNATVKKDSSTGDDFGGTTPLTIEFDGNGAPATFDGNATPPKIHIQWDDASTSAADSLYSLNLGTTGKSDGITSRYGTYKPISIKQDGSTFGNFVGVAINEEGLVTAQYDNGLALPIYKVAMARVASPDNLEQKSGGLWVPTDKSGDMQLTFAGSGGVGTIISGALESSTTNLAKSFTDIMRFQRGYAACATVIRTEKDLFEDLKRIG